MSDQIHYFDARGFKRAAKGDGGAPQHACVVKHYIADTIKQEGDEKERTLRFTISTGAVDRDRDTLNPKGFTLKNFRRNPVVLFAHDNSQPPIAKASKIDVEGESLKASATFMERDLSEFSDQIFRMIQGGFLKATSVGFMPLEFEFFEGDDEQREGGIDFLKQDLLEFSVVPVPSNPEALIEARSKGINTEPLHDWYEQVMDQWSDFKSVLPISRTEAARITKALEAKTRGHFHLSKRQQDDLLMRNLEAIKNGDMQGNGAMAQETPAVDDLDLTKGTHPNSGEQEGTGGTDPSANEHKDFKTVNDEVRDPVYDGTEETDWKEVDRSFDGFLAGYWKHNPDAEPVEHEQESVADLTDDQKQWMASKSLVGSVEAEEFPDLVALTVVNPDTDQLNYNGLHVADATSKESNLKDSTKSEVGEKVAKLLSDEFGEGEEIENSEEESYNGPPEDFDWPNPNDYNDDGDNENESDSAGNPESMSSTVRNVELTLANREHLIYQFHDGQVQAVDAVYDRGIALGPNREHQDLESLVRSDVPAGAYDVCLPEGAIKLGAVPDGPITCDAVFGDTSYVIVDEGREWEDGIGHFEPRERALAAGRLSTGTPPPKGTNGAEQPSQGRTAPGAVSKSTRMLPRIASRMFNTPLMVHEGKMHTILNVVGGRTGLDMGMLAQLLVEDDPDEDWQQRQNKKPYEVTEDGVAVISVLGTLVSRGVDMNNDSGMTGYDNIRSRFEEALADEDVKAIAFDFDSPGGEVNGLMDLVDDIYEARGTKPMWSIVNDMAYSAAFALATATDKIVMSRSSGVGSVGVVMVHADLSAHDHMRGVNFTLLHEGKRKVDGNDMGPLTPEAREEIEEEIRRHYDMFVETVARNLGVDEQTVRNTEARCYTGQKAIDVGFAHEVTRTKTAYRKIADLAKGAVQKDSDEEKAPPPSGETGVQTMIFSKENWTQGEAESWLSDHDMVSSKVDETEDSFRFRQFDPEACEEGSFSTLTEDFPEGVSAVVCTAKAAEGKKKSALTVNIEMSEELRAFKTQLEEIGKKLDAVGNGSENEREKALEDDIEIVDDTNSSDDGVSYEEVEAAVRKEINRMLGRID